MVLNNGLGRPKLTSRFSSAFEYLNKHIFPIKDTLFALKDLERKKEKEWLSARNKRLICEQQLERAYDGLENFRK